eukprot:TRINITY_DN44331_c0_g1_i1.p1 TRINITY_DN44331_c0_g1~~TRINITY_DN44331_c0_g1_i1.p1  ORF type:complete len:3453 (+),score=584.77 TRINITY_DN44331_c0_g1_i1:161-10519(+)
MVVGKCVSESRRHIFIIRTPSDEDDGVLNLSDVEVFARSHRATVVMLPESGVLNGMVRLDFRDEPLLEHTIGYTRVELVPMTLPNAFPMVLVIDVPSAPTDADMAEYSWYSLVSTIATALKLDTSVEFLVTAFSGAERFQPLAPLQIGCSEDVVEAMPPAGHTTNSPCLRCQWHDVAMTVSVRPVETSPKPEPEGCPTSAPGGSEDVPYEDDDESGTQVADKPPLQAPCDAVAEFRFDPEPILGPPRDTTRLDAEEGAVARRRRYTDERNLAVRLATKVFASWSPTTAEWPLTWQTARRTWLVAVPTAVLERYLTKASRAEVPGWRQFTMELAVEHERVPLELLVRTYEPVPLVLPSRVECPVGMPLEARLKAEGFKCLITYDKPAARTQIGVWTHPQVLEVEGVPLVYCAEGDAVLRDIVTPFRPFMLLGEARSGKSTFQRLLAELTAGVLAQQVGDKRDGAPQEQMPAWVVSPAVRFGTSAALYGCTVGIWIAPDVITSPASVDRDAGIGVLPFDVEGTRAVVLNEMPPAYKGRLLMLALSVANTLVININAPHGLHNEKALEEVAEIAQRLYDIRRKGDPGIFDMLARVAPSMLALGRNFQALPLELPGSATPARWAGPHGLPSVSEDADAMREVLAPAQSVGSNSLGNERVNQLRTVVRDAFPRLRYATLPPPFTGAPCPIQTLADVSDAFRAKLEDVAVHVVAPALLAGAIPISGLLPDDGQVGTSAHQEGVTSGTGGASAAGSACAAATVDGRTDGPALRLGDAAGDASDGAVYESVISGELLARALPILVRGLNSPSPCLALGAIVPEICAARRDRALLQAEAGTRTAVEAIAPDLSAVDFLNEVHDATRRQAEALAQVCKGVGAVSAPHRAESVVDIASAEVLLMRSIGPLLEKEKQQRQRAVDQLARDVFECLTNMQKGPQRRLSLEKHGLPRSEQRSRALAWAIVELGLQPADDTPESPVVVPDVQGLSAEPDDVISDIIDSEMAGDYQRAREVREEAYRLVVGWLDEAFARAALLEASVEDLVRQVIQQRAPALSLGSGTAVRPPPSPSGCLRQPSESGESVPAQSPIDGSPGPVQRRPWSTYFSAISQALFGTKEKTVSAVHSQSPGGRAVEPQTPLRNVKADSEAVDLSPVVESTLRLSDPKRQNDVLDILNSFLKRYCNSLPHTWMFPAVDLVYKKQVAVIADSVQALLHRTLLADKTFLAAFMKVAVKPAGSATTQDLESAVGEAVATVFQDDLRRHQVFDREAFVEPLVSVVERLAERGTPLEEVRGVPCDRVDEALRQLGWPSDELLERLGRMAEQGVLQRSCRPPTRAVILDAAQLLIRRVTAVLDAQALPSGRVLVLALKFGVAATDKLVRELQHPMREGGVVATACKAPMPERIVPVRPGEVATPQYLVMASCVDASTLLGSARVLDEVGLTIAWYTPAFYFVHPPQAGECLESCGIALGQPSHRVATSPDGTVVKYRLGESADLWPYSEFLAEKDDAKYRAITANAVIWSVAQVRRCLQPISLAEHAEQRADFAYVELGDWDMETEEKVVAAATAAVASRDISPDEAADISRTPHHVDSAATVHLTRQKVLGRLPAGCPLATALKAACDVVPKVSVCSWARLRDPPTAEYPAPQDSAKSGGDDAQDHFAESGSVRQRVAQPSGLPEPDQMRPMTAVQYRQLLASGARPQDLEGLIWDDRIVYEEMGQLASSLGVKAVSDMRVGAVKELRQHIRLQYLHTIAVCAQGYFMTPKVPLRKKPSEMFRPVVVVVQSINFGASLVWMLRAEQLLEKFKIRVVWPDSPCFYPSLLEVIFQETPVAYVLNYPHDVYVDAVKQKVIPDDPQVVRISSMCRGVLDGMMVTRKLEELHQQHMQSQTRFIRPRRVDLHVERMIVTRITDDAPLSLPSSLLVGDGRPVTSGNGGSAAASGKQSGAPSRMTVQVHRSDSLRTLQMMLQEAGGQACGAMIAASEQQVGGKVAEGYLALEEAYHLRTTLPHSMTAQRALPTKGFLSEFGVVVTEGVELFRGLYSGGGQVICDDSANVRPVAIPSFTTYAVASYRNSDEGVIEADGSDDRLTPGAAWRMALKIVSALRAAAAHGTRNLLLCALGCGMYGLPPRDVARVFREVLESGYGGLFERVWFAVIGDSHAEAFEATFRAPLTLLSVSGVPAQRSMLPACDRGGRCMHLDDMKHMQSFLHPPRCPQANSDCADAANSHVHRAVWIHLQACQNAATCPEHQSSGHTAYYSHPPPCSRKGHPSLCSSTDRNHCTEFWHPPMCRDGLTCTQRHQPAHANAFRHCRGMCPEGPLCQRWFQTAHQNATVHPFHPPCTHMFGCNLVSDAEHRSKFSHLCAFGTACEFLTDEAVRAVDAGTMDRLSQAQHTHLREFVHSGGRLCTHPGADCPERGVYHDRMFSHRGVRDVKSLCLRCEGAVGEGHKDELEALEWDHRAEPQLLIPIRHVYVTGAGYLDEVEDVLADERNADDRAIDRVRAEASLLRCPLFFSNAAKFTAAVLRWAKVSFPAAAARLRPCYHLVMNMRPVHRCSLATLKEVLSCGHFLSTRALSAEFDENDMASRAFSLLPALHSERFGERVRQYLAVAALGYAMPRINKVTQENPDVKPPYSGQMQEAVAQREQELAGLLADCPESPAKLKELAVDQVNAYFRVREQKVGKGASEDRTAGTDNCVFAMLGANPSESYGSALVVFRQGVLQHAETWISPMHAILYTNHSKLSSLGPEEFPWFDLEQFTGASVADRAEAAAAVLRGHRLGGGASAFAKDNGTPSDGCSTFALTLHLAACATRMHRGLALLDVTPEHIRNYLASFRTRAAADTHLLPEVHLPGRLPLASCVQEIIVPEQWRQTSTLSALQWKRLAAETRVTFLPESSGSYKSASCARVAHVAAPAPVKVPAPGFTLSLPTTADAVAYLPTKWPSAGATWLQFTVQGPGFHVVLTDNIRASTRLCIHVSGSSHPLATLNVGSHHTVLPLPEEFEEDPWGSGVAWTSAKAAACYREHTFVMWLEPSVVNVQCISGASIVERRPLRWKVPLILPLSVRSAGGVRALVTVGFLPLRTSASTIRHATFRYPFQLLRMPALPSPGSGAVSRLEQVFTTVKDTVKGVLGDRESARGGPLRVRKARGGTFDEDQFYRDRELPPDARLDKHGNPIAGDADAGMACYTGRHVVILNGYLDATQHLVPALKKKGFLVTDLSDMPPPEELDRYLAAPDRVVLMVIAAASKRLTSAHVDIIEKWHNSPKRVGVFLLGDAKDVQPQGDFTYQHDANDVAARLCKVDGQLQMSGSQRGCNVIKHRVEPKDSIGFNGDPRRCHRVLMGINSLYEGETIATITAPSPGDRSVRLVLPLVYGKGDNGNPHLSAALFDDKEGHRVVIDAAFTRLFCHWDEAGAARFYTNAVCWLSNAFCESTAAAGGYESSEDDCAGGADGAHGVGGAAAAGS